MDRFMFKLVITYPDMDELLEIVNITQKTMDEIAEAACSAKELLLMRETAKEIPVAEDVMKYAMKLVLATQPAGDYASETSKKYLRYGASPRAAQALITTAKVKALMNGRYNVSYDDINSLAYPVLRHRIKLNFEAVTGKVTADQVIEGIIKELNPKQSGVLPLFKNKK